MNSIALKSLAPSTAVDCPKHSPLNAKILALKTELGLMKPKAVLVNIARGGIVDDRALARTLKSGHLAGAGLDVAETEPLPPGNPLWDLPTLILSPHIAGGGAGEGGYRRQKDLFAENLRRLKAGEALINLVDCAT